MASYRDRESEQLGPFEWTRELTINLIELYKGYPCLWNPNHPYYRNRKINFAAYKAIASKLVDYNNEITVDEIRKRIQTLRCQYRRETKAEREHYQDSDRGPDCVFVPKLWCYKYLRFWSGDDPYVDPNLCPDLETDNQKVRILCRAQPFYILL